MGFFLPFLLRVAVSAQIPERYCDSVEPSTAASLRRMHHGVSDDHTSFPGTSRTDASATLGLQPLDLFYLYQTNPVRVA